MYKLELDKSSYYDFVLTDDEDLFYRDLSPYKIIDIDLKQSLYSVSGNTQSENVILENITLNGYDNSLLNFNIFPEYYGNVTANNAYSYTLNNSNTGSAYLHNFDVASGFTVNKPLLIEFNMPICQNSQDMLFAYLNDTVSSFNVFIGFNSPDGVNGFYQTLVNSAILPTPYKSTDLFSLYAVGSNVFLQKNGVTVYTFINTNGTVNTQYYSALGCFFASNNTYTINNLMVYNQRTYISGTTFDITDSATISSGTLSGQTISTTGFTTGITYTVYQTPFKLLPITGFTEGILYDIDTSETGYDQLTGGFYQGFFKLYGYPVEYFPTRMKKGWTVGMMLYLPTITNITGTTLNNTYTGNSNFIFYLGTRAENKFNTLTPTDVNLLTQNYGFNFVDGPSSGYTQTTVTNYGDWVIGTGSSTGSTFVPIASDLSTNPYYKEQFVVTSGDTYAAQPLALSGQTYNGHFDVISGITYDMFGNILTYDEKYVNIIDNAFGIRITPDGRIGYRTIYATDPCYTGATQDVSGITDNSFVDYSNSCHDYTVGKIITKYFTIEESYTRASVVSLNPINPKFLSVYVVYERDITYDTDCELEFGTYKNGTLKIYLNGFVVYNNKSVKEVIPHKLDTDVRLQEGVPFNLSFGGGTQGLYDAVFPDTGSTTSGVLDTFFAGTFTGGVTSIEMYSTPLYVTEIRSIMNGLVGNYNLFIPRGGRIINIKNTLP